MGDFPLTVEPAEIKTGTLVRETDEKPILVGDSSQVEGYLFSAQATVNYTLDFAKPLQDLVNHTFAGSVVFRVSLFDQVAKQYVDASDFNVGLDFSNVFKSLAISSVRFLGTQSTYAYYRLVVGGVLALLPPFYVGFRCGPYPSKKMLSTAYTCYVDINFAGSFYGASITVEAEQTYTRSLRPESSLAEGGSEIFCGSDSECLGCLCTLSTGSYCDVSSDFEIV